MMGIYALEPFLGTHYFKILTWPLIMTVFLNQLSTVLLYHFNRLTHVCIKIRLLQQMFIWLKLKRHERASPIFDYILGIFLAFLVKTCTYANYIIRFIRFGFCLNPCQARALSGIGTQEFLEILCRTGKNFPFPVNF